MTVEPATYLNTLNAALPAHTDGLDEADSHMRLIKQVLQLTFPNIAGAVSASDTDLSAVTAALASLTALQASAPSLTGTNTFTGQNTFAGLTSTTFLNAVNVQKGGFELVPTGVITLWWGNQGNVPQGWALCDGTNGTPDMRGLYVVGAGTEVVGGATVGYPAFTTGGSNFSTVTTDSQGSHTHGGFDQLGGGQVLTGSTDIQGSHSHGGSDQPTALTADQLPAHDHGLTGHNQVAFNTGSGPGGLSGGSSIAFFTPSSVGNGSPHQHAITVDGLHQHNISVSPVAAHQHAISADGVHAHTVVVPTQPASVAVCYIMKL